MTDLIEKWRAQMSRPHVIISEIREIGTGMADEIERLRAWAKDALVILELDYGPTANPGSLIYEGRKILNEQLATDHPNLADRLSLRDDGPRGGTLNLKRSGKLDH